MSRGLVALPSRQLRLGARTVEVRVRESPTATTTRILLGAQRPLEIIVPAGTVDEEIDAALRERRTWITEKLTAADAERARPHALGLAHAGTAWLHGTLLVVEVSYAARGSARHTDGRVAVAGPDVACRTQALVRWYRRTAKAALSQTAAVEADRLGLTVATVAVRDQRTRWGSCSATGNLSFNWRLVIAPEAVLRYVVVHELCHLLVPNHSKAFWRQLEAAAPGWQKQASWLAEHGAELRAYSPAAT